MNTSEQWRQFNLSEDNPDPGGGILYALRYATEDLRLHQDRVIESLSENGASIGEFQEQLVVDLPDVDTDEYLKARVMLEELSVVNEALEYHEARIVFGSISEMSSSFRSAYQTDLTPNGKIDAYNLVSLGIPRVAHDLQTAHAQNGVLSHSDVLEAEELLDFAKRQTHLLGGRGTIIIG